jgi:hypothetical protein
VAIMSETLTELAGPEQVAQRMVEFLAPLDKE